MKRYIPFLAATLAVMTSTTPFTASAMGDSKHEVVCPGAQLGQLHAHWHALVTEKNPEIRSHLISEHRKLIAQVKQTEVAVAQDKVPEDCKPHAGWHHYDLVNMVDKHSMMLDMIKK